jgi:UMF1 family MFS transporter
VRSKSSLDHVYRRIVNAWCMYDWGSSAFSTTIEGAVLPVYFEEVVAASLPGNTATVYWGYTNAISLLIAALLAPILGSIADYTGGKKRLLTVFAGLNSRAMASRVAAMLTGLRWI